MMQICQAYRRIRRSEGQDSAAGKKLVGQKEQGIRQSVYSSRFDSNSEGKQTEAGPGNERKEVKRRTEPYDKIAVKENVRVLMKGDGYLTTTDKEAAYTLAKYFLSVFTKKKMELAKRHCFIQEQAEDILVPPLLRICLTLYYISLRLDCKGWNDGRAEAAVKHVLG